MSIESVRITPDQVDKILQSRENHFQDLKSIDIAPSKLSRTIAAFANASGGELIIGVEDDTREWRGFPNQEAANSHIQVFERLFPLGQYYSYTFLEAENSPGLVLQVTIHKSPDIAKTSDGTVYLRRNAQNLPLTSEEGLRRLRLDKGIESFEKQTVDVDLAIITESITLSEFLKNIIPTAEPEQWLKKQLLIFQGKPTVSGLLLFGDEPQAVLPKRCAIKIYRYKTSADEGTRNTLAFDPITVEGCLYDQINDAVARTTGFVEEIPKIGKKGFESVRYPEEALHEIITNAVLHRDYSIAADVHVRIFDNRIEIESPGKLPGHITTENILREQFARNGTIVRIINKFPNPPNKDVGEGLNTAFLAMSKLSLKPPIIAEKENSVIVYVKHEPLASPEEAIMRHLETNDVITRKKALEVTGLSSESSISTAFFRMKAKGMIEVVPGTYTRNAAWRRVVSGREEPSRQKPETSILEYLYTHAEITNKIARSITGIQSQKAVGILFRKLKDKGLIEGVPGKSKKGSAWRSLANQSTNQPDGILFH